MNESDLAPLFDPLSEESVKFSLEMMHETYKSFKIFVQQHAEPPTEGEDASHKNHNKHNVCTGFGQTVFANACCPPPVVVSSAAFDDTVIKLLGDRGGVDPFFWEKIQDINLEDSSICVSSSVHNNGNAISGSYGQYMETDSQGFDAVGTADSESHPNAVGNSGVFTNGHINSISETCYGLEPLRSDDPVQLIKRYGKALVESFISDRNKLFPTSEKKLSQLIKLAPKDTATLTSTLADSSSASSSSVSLTRDMLLHMQSHGEAHSTRDTTVALGKRGRYYLDVWDEEEFISRMKTSTKLRPLYSWEDLFQPGYCDNHDGCYRDWLLNRQEVTKARLNDPKYKKVAKRKSYDPIFRYDVAPDADNSALSILAPPPVPVSIQHPASWAVRSRHTETFTSGAGRRNSLSIDVSAVHPASCTSTTVYPIHQKQRLAATTNRRKGGAAVPAADCEDVDDFNIHADRLLSNLYEQEVTNFIRLARLQQAIKLHDSDKMRVLADKRRKLEDLVTRAVQSMEPTSADRVVYAFKPNKVAPLMRGQRKQSTGEVESYVDPVVRLDATGEVIQAALPQEVSAANSHSRYNTRCATDGSSSSSGSFVSKSEAAANKHRRDLLGGSAARHVAHGTTLAQCLQPGAEVEVCLSRVWQVATVCRVIYDGEHIRHVKVTPLDCTAMESVWLSVEDGKIAPYGTYLRPITVPPAKQSTAAETLLSLSAQEARESENRESTMTKDTFRAVVTSTGNVNQNASSLPMSVHRVVTDGSPPMPLESASRVSGQPTSRVSPLSAHSYGNKDINKNGHPIAYVNYNHIIQDQAASRPSSHAIPVATALQATDTHHRLSQLVVGQVADPRLRKVSSSLQDYHTPIHSIGAGAGAGVGISSGSFPVRNGFTFVGTASSAPVEGGKPPSGTTPPFKIPLPMGATDKRELIPASTYIPLSFPASAPQPFNPYTRHRFGPAGSAQSVNHRLPAPAPYEYEYEGAGEIHQRPVFDCVGFHSTSTVGATATATAAIRPTLYVGGDSVIGKDTQEENPGNPPTVSALNTTFRLGKKGAITRN